MAPAGHGTGSTPSGTSPSSGISKGHKGRPFGLAFGSDRHGPYVPDGEGRAASRSGDGLRSPLARSIPFYFTNSTSDFRWGFRHW